MKTILIPTDFSAASENALAYALTLAKEFNSEITLLHAYHTIPAQPEIPSRDHEEELKQLRTASEQKLEAVCSDIRKLSQLECNSILVEGYAKNEIVSHACEGDSDLLVMATESINPIDKIVFGTITGKVLKKVKCPILIVPQEASFQHPKKIAFALDYHESDLKDLRFMIELAQKFKTELHVLRVAATGADKDFEDKLMKDFKERIDQEIADCDITWHLVSGENVAKALGEFAASNSIDLLATAKSKLNFLKKVFSGSITQKLFYKTHIPLLIFQASDSDLRSYRLTKPDNYE